MRKSRFIGAMVKFNPGAGFARSIVSRALEAMCLEGRGGATGPVPLALVPASFPTLGRARSVSG
jgi:hypothetical protein